MAKQLLIRGDRLLLALEILGGVEVNIGDSVPWLDHIAVRRMFTTNVGMKTLLAFLRSNREQLGGLEFEIGATLLESSEWTDNMHPRDRERKELVVAQLWAYLATFASGQITETDLKPRASAPTPDDPEAVDEALLTKLLVAVEENGDRWDLSVRTLNCLSQAGLAYLGQVVQRTEAELLKTKNFGRKSLKELRLILDDYGLKIGMKISAATIAEFERRGAEIQAEAEKARLGTHSGGGMGSSA